MPDLLVRLYDLKDDWTFIQSQAQLGVTIRKPIGPEQNLLVRWVRDNFNPAWSSETNIAFSNVPKTCFVAVKERQLSDEDLKSIPKKSMLPDGDPNRNNPIREAFVACIAHQNRRWGELRVLRAIIENEHGSAGRHIGAQL